MLKYGSSSVNESLKVKLLRILGKVHRKMGVTVLAEDSYKFRPNSTNEKVAYVAVLPQASSPVLGS